MKILKQSELFRYSIPEELESKFDYWIEISSDGKFETFGEWLDLDKEFEEYKVLED